MKKLLNTLFVTSEDAYLTLDGENVVDFRSMPSPKLSASAMQARLRRSWARAQNAM